MGSSFREEIKELVAEIHTIQTSQRRVEQTSHDFLFCLLIGSPFFSRLALSTLTRGSPHLCSRFSQSSHQESAQFLKTCSRFFGNLAFPRVKDGKDLGVSNFFLSLDRASGSPESVPGVRFSSVCLVEMFSSGEFPFAGGSHHVLLCRGSVVSAIRLCPKGTARCQSSVPRNGIV